MEKLPDCHQWFSENMHTFWILIFSIIDKGSCLPLSQFSACNVTKVDGNCWNMCYVILEGVILRDPLQRQNEERGNFKLGVMQTGYRNRDSNMLKGWTKSVQRFFRRVIGMVVKCWIDSKRLYWGHNRLLSVSLTEFCIF